MAEKKFTGWIPASFASASVTRQGIRLPNARSLVARVLERAILPLSFHHDHRERLLQEGKRKRLHRARLLSSDDLLCVLDLQNTERRSGITDGKPEVMDSTVPVHVADVDIDLKVLAISRQSAGWIQPITVPGNAQALVEISEQHDAALT